MKGKTLIKIQGNLDEKWKNCFDFLTITYEKNSTILLVDIKDESHLHGILNLIRDLNIVLISVNTIEEEPDSN